MKFSHSNFAGQVKPNNVKTHLSLPCANVVSTVKWTLIIVVYGKAIGWKILASDWSGEISIAQTVYTSTPDFRNFTFQGLLSFLIILQLITSHKKTIFLCVETTFHLNNFNCDNHPRLIGYVPHWSIGCYHNIRVVNTAKCKSHKCIP